MTGPLAPSHLLHGFPTKVEARPPFGFLEEVAVSGSLDICSILHQEGHQCHVPPFNGNVQCCLAYRGKRTIGLVITVLWGPKEMCPGKGPGQKMPVQPLTVRSQGL